MQCNTGDEATGRWSGGLWDRGKKCRRGGDREFEPLGSQTRRHGGPRRTTSSTNRNKHNIDR